MGLFRLLRLFRKVLSRPPSNSRAFLGRRSNDSDGAPFLQLTPLPPDTVLKGQCWVIDGDTIVINNTHIRLAGIDAPELDHPWGSVRSGRWSDHRRGKW